MNVVLFFFDYSKLEIAAKLEKGMMGIHAGAAWPKVGFG